MRNFKAILSYDGTRYSGWQKQGNTKNTIQEKLETLLKTLLEEDVHVIGSGRTDAGVHAKAQVINFHSVTKLNVNDLFFSMNHFLPEDIRVMKVEEVEEDFHARFHVENKTYRYTIHRGAVNDVFTRDFAWHIYEKLNLKAMKRASDSLIGEHDFRGFSDYKRLKKSTIRTIDQIDFTEDGDYLYIDITADGFLYHMARRILGALIEVGLGKRSVEEFPTIFEGAEHGFLAEAKGLMLYKVRYRKKA